ncbi:hypothetical protein D3C75_900140 [compost metagenome]
MQLQLPVLEGVAQMPLNLHPFGKGLLQRRTVHNIAALTGFLGFVHGHIGKHQQLLRRLAVLRIPDNTDAGGQMNDAASNQERLLQPADQLIRRPGNGFRGLETLMKHHEFVPAKTVEDALHSVKGLQPPTDQLNQFIPYGITHGVIDIFEIIDIHIEDNRTSIRRLHITLQLHSQG